MAYGLVITVFCAWPAALAAIVPPVSDPVAVYALVTRVELLPDAEAPRAVRLHGAFAVADGARGDYYRSPRWGSLLFHAVAGEEEKCLAQWADLARAAGSGEVVGFGFRHDMGSLRVQPPGAETDAGAPYPTGYGLRRVRNVDYGPALALRLLPRPHSPAADAELQAWSYAAPGEASMVTLVAEACPSGGPGTKYLFQIERPNGDVVGSPPVDEENGRATWSVWLVAEPGEAVTWRVRVLRDGVERAPVATARFTAKAKPS